MIPDASLRLAIIGVGLIGGSLARALRAAGVVKEVVGVSRTRATLDRAVELGVIDRGATDVSAAGQSDIVLLATPVRAMPEVMAALAPHLRKDTVVTDAGSVKIYVCEAAEKHLGEAAARFVPGHPIAGTEHSGVEASFASLFEGRSVILTPRGGVSGEAIDTVASMWQVAGANVIDMSPERHDEILAATSHLPHMVAYALVNCLAGHPQSEELFNLAAGGFYDFTRIASSDPVMWRDIGLTNREPLVASMRHYRAELDALIEALEAGDGSVLHDMFTRAKQARDLGLARKNGDGEA